MMTSTLCTCTWLLLPCCVLVTLSTGELDFYQDEVPKSLDRVSLRQLIKYLEDQKTILSSLLANKARKKNLFDALANKESIAEFLRKEKYPDRWNHRRMRYNEPINELPEQRGRYFPFYKFNSFESPLEEYPDFELPYFPRAAADEDTTYERHPFAVKPNDPRYYQDGPFSLDDDDDEDDDDGDEEEEKSDFEKPTKNETEWQRKDTEMEEVHDVREERPRNIESKFKDTSVVVVPDLERRPEYNPLFVPVNQDFDSDIYFIAVVAGCSAAAIFALVIIALTWCRLKRSAKAAADIEYPAYGVTGPNKEISPSGDQRLAQSAQMYHFQHQKQQIIAMENRISATRDPGSVSEAESDEENEEGDYTVYECPGLASTGEMEVKNPLFHDDPTPATPAQTNKKEDHI